MQLSPSYSFIVLLIGFAPCTCWLRNSSATQNLHAAFWQELICEQLSAIPVLQAISGWLQRKFTGGADGNSLFLSLILAHTFWSHLTAFVLNPQPLSHTLPPEGFLSFPPVTWQTQPAPAWLCGKQERNLQFSERLALCPKLRRPRCVSTGLAGSTTPSALLTLSAGRILFWQRWAGQKWITPSLIGCLCGSTVFFPISVSKAHGCTKGRKKPQVGAQCLTGT